MSLTNILKDIFREEVPKVRIATPDTDATFGDELPEIQAAFQVPDEPRLYDGREAYDWYP